MEMIKLKDREYRLLRDLVYDNFGINLGDHKRWLVVGRLNNVLKEYGFDNFKDYYEYVISDPTKEALSTLIDRISTNHTFFYRESDHFNYLKDTVLTEIVTNLNGSRDKKLRIWSAGCSSGEEPYMLGIIVSEFFSGRMINWDIGILATDISIRKLNDARLGIYLESNVSKLPPTYRNKYFYKNHCEGTWVVKKSLKDLIMFRRLNLMRKEFPFKGKFNIIFCRNVMIYFDRKTRENLINSFYRYTEKGGYLFIGHSESLPRESCSYKYIKPGIYKKIE